MSLEFKPAIVLSALFLMHAAVVWGQAKPDVKSVAPLGIRAGHTTQTSVYGDNLAPKQVLCTKSGVKVTLKAAHAADEKTKNKGNSEVALLVDVAASAAADSVEISLVQADGSKATAVIAVVPDVHMETVVKKPASTYATAMPVPGDSTAITGTLDNDTADVFKIEAKQGETWEISLLCGRGGSTLDPVLRVRDFRHICLMLSAGDKKRDRRLIFKAPHDGTYYIEITDAEAKGGAGYDYRLTVIRTAA